MKEKFNEGTVLGLVQDDFLEKDEDFGYLHSKFIVNSTEGTFADVLESNIDSAAIVRQDKEIFDPVFETVSLVMRNLLKECSSLNLESSKLHSTLA
jgi:hypothetical protein